MLSQVEQEKTPLTRQLDQLTVLLTIMAGAALALVVVLGLIRGDDWTEAHHWNQPGGGGDPRLVFPQWSRPWLSMGTQALAGPRGRS